MIKVWDPVVRVFHWTVVAACVLNLFILEDDGQWHRWAGYVAAAALAIRVVWGFVGTYHARFVNFVPGPRTLVDYLVRLAKGNAPRYVGHNPAGSVMMIALMVLLAATSLSGYLMTTDAFWGTEFMEEAHELLANAILVLALLHAAAAIFGSFKERENLVWSMVTGWKRQ
jgi:cytochrome b